MNNVVMKFSDGARVEIQYLEKEVVFHFFYNTGMNIMSMCVSNKLDILDIFIRHRLWPQEVSKYLVKFLNEYKINGKKLKFASKVDCQGIVWDSDMNYYSVFFFFSLDIPLKTETLDISNLKLIELPNLKNLEVFGDFDCSLNKIPNLKGSPKLVYGHYDCRQNRYLTNLEGSPDYIKGDFNCTFCNLHTLKGGPIEVYGNYYCAFNKLTDLCGIPETIMGNCSCIFNRLDVLKGSPKYIHGDFDLSHNKLSDTSDIMDTIVDENVIYSSENLQPPFKLPKSFKKVIYDKGLGNAVIINMLKTR